MLRASSHRKLRLEVEPLLLLAGALAAGTYAPSAFFPAGLLLLALVALPGGSHGTLRRVATVAIFLVAALVSRSQVQAHEALRLDIAKQLGAPRRCEGEAIVAKSPTWHGGGPASSGDAPIFKVALHVERMECAGLPGQENSSQSLLSTVDLGPKGIDVSVYAEAKAITARAGADLATQSVAPRRGDRTHFIAELAPPTRFLVEELPDGRPSETMRGTVLSGAALDLQIIDRPLSVTGLIDGARNTIRRRIQESFLPDAEAFARALVIGENDLAADDDRAFRDSGLSHLLAVSGMHVVLVVATLVQALRALLARIAPLAARYDTRKIAASAGIPLAILYADFSGGSGSAWRAAVTASLAFLMTATGRRAPALRHLAASPFVLALGAPLIATDVSFQLSFGATFGLLVFARPLTEVLTKWTVVSESEEKHTETSMVQHTWRDWAANALRKGWAFVAPSLATTMAATIPTIPLLARLGGRLPLLAVPLNGIAVPLGEIAALPLCLLHAVAAPVPQVAQGAALAAGGALRLLAPLARFGAAAPGFAVPPPTPLQGAALAFAAIASAAYFAGPTPDLPSPRIHRRPFGRALLASLALACVGEAALRYDEAHPSELCVTHIDVGQGDSTLVTLPTGALLLIDGGGFVGSPIDPGVTIAALLRARRRSHVDVVALSHPHPDHFGGLTTGTSNVTVGEFWNVAGKGTAGENPAVVALRAHLEARGAISLGPQDLCGSRDAWQGVALRFFAPCPRAHEGWSTNDNSLVFQLSTPYGSELFVGDAEHEAEAGLLDEHRAELASTVLKVGHHGSRTSSSQPFLEAVAPRVAVASSGLRNRFGHPHPTTVGRFAANGIPLLVTSAEGAVTFRFAKEGLRVERATAGLFDPR